MMLWLLATLSVVTTFWGIAHRLKAVNPAANCPRERCSCAPTANDDVRNTVSPKNDPPNLERRLPTENPQLRHNMHEENNA
jgi:hypothetical protein